jgi:hypothetical protein
VVRSVSTINCVPRDRANSATPAIIEATTDGRRHSHSAATTTTTSSGSPKNALYSADPLASRSLAVDPPTDSGEYAV